MTSKLTIEQARRLRNDFECWQQDYDPKDDKEQYDMFGRGMVAMDMLIAGMYQEPVAFINGAWTLVYYRPPKELGMKIGDKLYHHAQQPLVRPAPECEHQWRHGGVNKLQNQKQCIKCGRVELDAQRALVVPDERAAFNAWNNEDNLPIAGVSAKNAAWLAWQARAKLAGNSPVIPDRWIPVSERMPEEGQHIIIFCDGAFVLSAQHRDGEFFDVVRDGDEFFETTSRCVTHWMPLPSAPQEVDHG